MIKLEKGAVIRFAITETEANRLENKGYKRVGEIQTPEKEPNVKEIKLFADEQGIDIGRATTYDGILTKIQEAGFTYPPTE